MWRWFWKTGVGRYTMRVLLAVDQLGNTLLGGQEDETISSRIGRAKLDALVKGKRLNIGWRTIDHFLDWIDPGHSINAIEPDEVREWLASYPNARLKMDRSGKVVGLETS